MDYTGFLYCVCVCIMLFDVIKVLIGSGSVLFIR